MSFEEMFANSECCGMISVRASTSKSGKFVKKWVALLNYTQDGSNYFWAVLAKNAPGDFPAKDYFLQEIRVDTEFKQDRKHNMKEFTFQTTKHYENQHHNIKLMGFHDIFIIFQMSKWLINISDIFSCFYILER